MNNQYRGNEAIYGKSIGSFAFALKLINKTKNNLMINSGEESQETIFVGIFD